ncbi:MAG: SH3 domain-containing protein, partial [Verrucomicrobiota bacterium]|nr:SH3 domain-containing protein [Verrucomicrobiota bacterium]
MKTTLSRILIPALTLAVTTLLIAQTAPPIPAGPGAPPTRQPEPPAQPVPTPAVPAPSPEIIPPTVTPAVPATPAVPLVPPTITPPVVPPTVTPPIAPPAAQPPVAPKPVPLTLPTPPASIGLGVITGKRVSARGKATVHSQLVFRFGQNEPVNLLEEITLAAPKAGEPRKWYRVQVPLDAGLWVHHQFLHNQRIVTIVGNDGKPSPHTYASVKPNRLNVRGGAGDAFPVLGQLPQGTDVALTGAQKGKWLEIFAPGNCSVYVASQFVKRANGNVANIVEVPTLPVQPQPDIQPQPPIILPLQPGTIAPSVPGAAPAVPAETTITVDPKTFGNPGGTTTPGGVGILPKPPKPTAPAITKLIEPAKPAVPTKPVQVAKANPNLPPPSKPV